MTPEYVPVTEARTRLYELITDVIPRRPVMLLRHSRPAAVLLSPTAYEELTTRIEQLENEIALLADRAGTEEYEPLENVAAEIRRERRPRRRRATG